MSRKTGITLRQIVRAARTALDELQQDPRPMALERTHDFGIMLGGKCRHGIRNMGIPFWRKVQAEVNDGLGLGPQDDADMYFWLHGVAHTAMEMGVPHPPESAVGGVSTLADDKEHAEILSKVLWAISGVAQRSKH